MFQWYFKFKSVNYTPFIPISRNPLNKLGCRTLVKLDLAIFKISSRPVNSGVATDFEAGRQELLGRPLNVFFL